MAESRKEIPACVYVLADHLDAGLAAGEDLVKAGLNWPSGEGSDPAIAVSQRWAAGRMRTHEYGLIAHLLQARSAAKELARGAQPFRSSAHLFSSGLQEFEDLQDDVFDDAAGGFHSGPDIVAFLRTRGIIEKDAPGALPCEPIAVSDRYLVAGRIPLGVVLDYVSEFLEALDLHYDLYPDEERSSENDGPDGSDNPDNSSGSGGVGEAA